MAGAVPPHEDHSGRAAIVADNGSIRFLEYLLPALVQAPALQQVCILALQRCACQACNGRSSHCFCCCPQHDALTLHRGRQLPCKLHHSM